MMMMMMMISLLYATANIAHKFSKCSRDVKLCLFRAYCTQFYGAELWKSFHTSVYLRFEVAYVKCVKTLFGFQRKDSVIAMFYDLGLPTFKTIIHNAKVKMASRLKKHSNVLIRSSCIAERV